MLSPPREDRAREPCTGACAIGRKRLGVDVSVRPACTGIGRTRGLVEGANACAGAGAAGGWAGDGRLLPLSRASD
jgi:hypothetical protein